MISAQQLDALDPQTRKAMQALLAQVQQRAAEIAVKLSLIDRLRREMAVLKRMKLAAWTTIRSLPCDPECQISCHESLTA